MVWRLELLLLLLVVSEGHVGGHGSGNTGVVFLEKLHSCKDTSNHLLQGRPSCDPVGGTSGAQEDIVDDPNRL